MTRIKEELRLKLDAFIRKYYQSKLLRGGMYFLGLGILYFLAVAFLEHLGNFSGNVRLGLLLALIGGLAAILFIYIITPLLGLFRLGKHLSYQKAAHIIGAHFPEVSDKITNTLELSTLTDSENRLIQASIEQRIQNLNPIPFTGAVDYRENLKYWPILVVPTFLFLIILVSGQWGAISESSKRIVEYRKEFTPEAPFQFMLLNESLKVEQGEDLNLQLTFWGESLPESAQFISDIGNGRFVKNGANRFEYRLENVEKSFRFNIYANGFESKSYEVEVLAVPKVRSFAVRVVPPAYTKVPPFTTEMKSVIDVPEGSRLSWSLKAEATREAILKTNDTSYAFSSEEEGKFSLQQRVMNNFSYRLLTRNQALEKQSSTDNVISIIKDEYPEIGVEIQSDSSVSNVLFYKGQISDDYGFSRLELMVEEGQKTVLQQGLDINKSNISQLFSGVLSLDSLSGKGRNLRVFFRVWDNDGVNGAKSAVSSAYQLKIRSVREKREEVEKQFQSYFSERQEMEKMSEELQKQMEALKAKMMNSKKADWKDRERFKELMVKQQQLLERQAELEKERKELQQKEEKVDPRKEEIKEEEKKIEDLLDKEKQKELEELMKDIEKLMDKLNMEQLQEKLEQMEQMSDQNQRNEERIDELLKKLQFKKDVLKEAEKLSEMAERMKELSQKSENSEEEAKEQAEVSKQLEDSQKKIEELKKENPEFAEETEKQELGQKQEETEQNMQDASEQLNKNQQQKANESQEKSGENMEQMSEMMMQSMMQMEGAQHQEDMKTLRQILENLETLSFNVEELSELSKKSGKSDPLYRKLLVDQKRLQDGTKVIEDSLMALGSRVPEIKEKVYEELDAIKTNLDKSIQTLEEQNGGQAAAYQQFVMTAANNLALLLDEALQQMQMQMASKMQGSQTCQKPGSGKPSISNMRKMQNELAKQMGEMKQGKKEGESQQKGKGRDGKEIVEMLSRQEQIRNQLQEYMEQEGTEGNQGNLKKALEEMEELERDLLDGNIRPETLKRMQEIETRLLESEKAELEQKQDEKRESKTAEDKNQTYQKELEKYLKEKQGQKESIYTSPINMKRYYKSQSNQFLNQE